MLFVRRLTTGGEFLNSPLNPNTWYPFGDMAWIVRQTCYAIVSIGVINFYQLIPFRGPNVNLVFAGSMVVCSEQSFRDRLNFAITFTLHSESTIQGVLRKSISFLLDELLWLVLVVLAKDWKCDTWPLLKNANIERVRTYMVSTCMGSISYLENPRNFSLVTVLYNRFGK